MNGHVHRSGEVTVKLGTPVTLSEKSFIGASPGQKSRREGVAGSPQWGTWRVQWGMVGEGNTQKITRSSPEGLEG